MIIHVDQNSTFSIYSHLKKCKSYWVWCMTKVSMSSQKSLLQWNFIRQLSTFVWFYYCYCLSDCPLKKYTKVSVSCMSFRTPVSALKLRLKKKHPLCREGSDLCLTHSTQENSLWHAWFVISTCIASAACLHFYLAFFILFIVTQINVGVSSSCWSNWPK